MKIALLSPIVWRTPPLKYGPWEQVASNIAEGLVAQGIDVTLYATANSTTKGTLEFVSETAYGEDKKLDPKVWEALHISNLMENAHKYDIIHNHYDFLPLTFSKLISTPMVTTIHGFSSEKIVSVYKKYNTHTNYVSISNSNRHKELDYIATVYNGIDGDCFDFKEQANNYLLFFGRIHPDKGTHDAIEIAKQLNKRLIIAGLIQDEKYFKKKIKPHIDGCQIIYVGNADSKQRNTLLGGAEALLHPIHFDEPFGLSVVESMFCGTPVIAYNRGSMSEIIENGVNGYLVNTINEAVLSYHKIKEIDRKKCETVARNKFSKETMSKEYINVYNSILQAKK